jgi:hypothetical protein
MSERGDDRPPWKKKNPKKGAAKKLTGEQRFEARARAKAAGRPYPNLVDNMAVARKTQSARKAKSVKKTTSKAKSRPAVKRKNASLAAPKRKPAVKRKQAARKKR